MADIFCANLDQLRSITSNTIVNLTEAYIGTLRRKFIYINNEGGQDDSETVIVPLDNPPSGRWICPQGSLIPNQQKPWNKIDKTGSSLADLETKSASDLTSGLLDIHRLPNSVLTLDTKTPLKVLITDNLGNLVLGNVKIDQVDGDIPYTRINWDSFEPSEIGAEAELNFDSNYFNRDNQNISIKLMTGDQPGLAVPGKGIQTDKQGRILVDFGTGPGQSLEGNQAFLGDLSGSHTSALVDGLRGIPLTFFKNEVNDKNDYVLTLDATNPEAPNFYLAPSGGKTGVPSIDNKIGALLTNGLETYWGKIPQSMIKEDFTITSFICSVLNAEVGQTITNPSFSITYNDKVESATIIDSDGHSNVLIYPFTSFISNNNFVKNIIGSVNFSITALDTNQNSSTKSTSILWLARNIYGVLPADNNYINLINSLQYSQLSSSRAGRIVVNASETDYIWFACPSSFGTPIFSVGGFVGGFQLIATNIEITNAFGIVINYDLYRSDNLNLGITTVDVS